MFEQALQFVLAREGGYVNHPLDKGGPTNKGITQGTFDAWRSRLALPTSHVKDITAAEVEAIYRRNYWIGGRCDDIARTHPDTAIAHFDACVNHGLIPAIRMLQRAIGTVKVDGSIGNQTMGALIAMNDSDLSKRYLEQRYRFYHQIVASKPSQSVFLRGWLSRIRHLAHHLNLEWHQ